MSCRDHRIAIAVILLVALRFGPAAAAAQVNVARIDSLVDSRRQALGLPGLALSVVHPIEVMHARGYGARQPSGEALSADTPFPLDVARQPLIATLLFQLVDEGAIDLEGPATRYLRTGSSAETTLPSDLSVHQLLRRTRGTPEGNDRTLAHILETVTGASLAHLVAMRICGRLARPCPMGPDGTAALSARHLGQFLRAHLNLGRLGDSILLSSAGVIEMTTFDSGARHAAGWDWRGSGDRTAIGASATAAAAQGELVLFTAEGVGVVLLADAAGPEQAAAIQRLAVDIARVSVGLAPLPLPSHMPRAAWWLVGALALSAVCGGTVIALRRRIAG